MAPYICTSSRVDFSFLPFSSSPIISSHISSFSPARQTVSSHFITLIFTGVLIDHTGTKTCTGLHTRLVCIHREFFSFPFLISLLQTSAVPPMLQWPSTPPQDHEGWWPCCTLIGDSNWIRFSFFFFSFFFCCVICTFDHVIAVLGCAVLYSPVYDSQPRCGRHIPRLLRTRPLLPMHNRRGPMSSTSTDRTHSIATWRVQKTKPSPRSSRAGSSKASSNRLRQRTSSPPACPFARSLSTSSPAVSRRHPSSKLTAMRSTQSRYSSWQTDAKSSSPCLYMRLTF